MVTKSSSISGSFVFSVVETFSEAFVSVGFCTSLADIDGGGRDEIDVEGEGLRLCPDILRVFPLDEHYFRDVANNTTYSPSSRSTSSLAGR